MKQIDKMSRLTGELEKAFRLLNAELFGNALDTPIITVIPSSRSYAHYTPWESWQTKEGGKHEINIASGTLDRPLENIIASLTHEMVHMYNDTVLNIADCSGSNGAYHNKYFKHEAEAHGLTVSRSEKYGWSITAPNDTLLNFVLEHDELREIEICRVSPAVLVSIGAHSGSVGALPAVTPTKSHHRKYMCPCCGISVRATKAVNIACMDCKTPMLEV